MKTFEKILDWVTYFYLSLAMVGGLLMVAKTISYGEMRLVEWFIVITWTFIIGERFERRNR